MQKSGRGALGAFSAMSLSLMVLVGAAQAAGSANSYVPLQQRLSPEQLHSAGLDKLSVAELARLNELLQAEASVASVKAAAADAAPAPRHGAERGVASFIGMDARPITTRLKGSVASWRPGTVFQLENGQTWTVLKGSMTLRKPMDAPEVVLVPGVAGRWFLQIDKDLPKARVYRTD